MHLQSRHLGGAVVIAMAAHVAALAWLVRPVMTPPIGGSYSVLRVQLGDLAPLQSAAPVVEVAPVPEVPPAPVVPPPPQPPPPPKAKPKPKPVQRKIVAEQPTRPQRQPTPSSVVAAPVAPVPQVPAPVAPAAGSNAGAAAAGVAGPSRGAPGRADTVGDPALPPSYVSEVRGWLERHRTYPLAARRQRIEGRAVLWFRIDRQGRVLAYRIEQSSGHGMIDRAVIQMIERASPLPKVPATYPVAEPEFVIPIDFRLR